MLVVKATVEGPREEDEFMVVATEATGYCTIAYSLLCWFLCKSLTCQVMAAPGVTTLEQASASTAALKVRVHSRETGVREIWTTKNKLHFDLKYTTFKQV